jgi:ubiquinone/menaquinone biosynthesis C-methylase UbiE
MEAKYDAIGINYNETRKADPYLVSQFYKLLNPIIDNSYLDIGCGTGNYTIALQNKGLQFSGIDPSLKMLDEAKKKAPPIKWKLGTAEQTGLASESVDGITACLTLHHWADVNKGFVELYRVLKPQSKLVIFTSTPKQMKGYWLHHYFPKMLADAIKQMPKLKNVLTGLTKAGFKTIEQHPYFVKLDLEDLFLYSGKHVPEIYFNTQIRQGISSFSDLAHQDEIISGLAHLKSDIASGDINNIIKKYKNDTGDYLFIVGQKA